MATSGTTETPVPNACTTFSIHATECERRFLDKFKSDEPSSIGQDATAKLKRLRGSIKFSKHSENIMTKCQQTILDSTENLKRIIIERQYNITDETLNPIIDSFKESWFESNYPNTHTKTKEVEKQMRKFRKDEPVFGCFIQGVYFPQLKARDVALEKMYGALKEVGELIDGHENPESDRNSNVSTKKRRMYGSDRNSETTKKPRKILPKVITESGSRPQISEQSSSPQTENVDTDTATNSEITYDPISTDETSTLFGGMTSADQLLMASIPQFENVDRETGIGTDCGINSEEISVGEASTFSGDMTFEHQLSMEDDDFDWAAYLDPSREH